MRKRLAKLWRRLRARPRPAPLAYVWRLVPKVIERFYPRGDRKGNNDQA